MAETTAAPTTAEEKPTESPAPVAVENNKEENKEEESKEPVLDEKGEHLLQSPWTFWFARKLPKTQITPTVNYAEHLQKIASFSTVEGFYKTYCYIARPLEMPKESNFHMFKGDVIPMWESFPNGGCWIIKINKKHPQLSLIWEELLVYAIGEVFEEPDIVGVVLSVRQKEYMLAVWNADSQNAALRMRVCDKLKYFLRLDPNTPIEYKHNSTSMRDKSTYRNGKIVAPKKDKKKKKKGSKQPAPAHAPAHAHAHADTTHAPTTQNAPAPTPAPAPSQNSTPAAPAPTTESAKEVPTTA